MAKEKKGIIRTKIEVAFKYLIEGNLIEYTRIIVDVSNVKYAWHKDIVTDEIKNQFKLLTQETLTDNPFIQEIKKQLILNKL